MNLRPRFRLWLLWLVAFGLLMAVVLFPISYRITRAATVVLGLVTWLGLIALVWRKRWLSVPLLGFTLLVATFLVLPGRSTRQTEPLRAEYLAKLRRYKGVRYIWGGESFCGIDCSGLIRRGLIDALFSRGVSTADAALVRQAIGLWWHDCTASALGAGQEGLTVPVLETPKINALDHSQIRPGDLAVTTNGIHIMAYLGGQRWIEADPGIGSVVVVTAPSSDNGWFHGPMRIVRWTMLQ